ncbi:palmitoyltransferase [Elysia marginata]|uniref:Palmitoyltransferase n=1 Tax=Elysia marginata TaxID=1093978 RepID=A0AAV4ES90_9GAST|nr:palmitoyltransferase [Elysia marginata]
MAGQTDGCEECQTLAEQPGDLVMDRSEVGSKPKPHKDSLREKLRAHYQKGMNKRRAKSLSNPLTPEIINRVAVPFFLFTVIASFKIGFVDVMPLMYEGYDHVILLQRCFITLLWVEMMVNWLGIRYVDSTYTRYLRLYGPPPHERMNARSSPANQMESSTAQAQTVIGPENRLSPWLGVKPDSPNTTKDSCSSLMDISQTQTDSPSLNYQVHLANKEMDKRINLVNTKSIDDLLNPVHQHSAFTSHTLNKEEFSSPSSLFFTQNDSEQISDRKGSLEKTHNKMATQSTSSSLTSPTPVITTQGNVITKAYPYWSWVPCYPCGRARPPRCHHCPLCKACVLKRDHHCFFAGSCVGYRNHRFFYIFLIWAWTGCMYATLHGFPYIGFFLWAEMSYMDVFFPLAIARFLFGYVPFQAALSVTTLTFLVYFDLLAATFIYSHTLLISRGVTSFEVEYLKNSLEIRDTRTLGQKINGDDIDDQDNDDGDHEDDSDDDDDDDDYDDDDDDDDD